MNFSSKKRPRNNAWRDLQKELDEREKLEEENSVKFARMDALRARTALEDELDPEKTHAYMDIVIGRDAGKDPQLTKGRLIFELFDDIMPRTVEQFIRMLEAKVEPMYAGSTISKILPSDHCLAGDRTSKIEGATSGRELVFSRVEQEANWQVPHLNPGVLSLADAKSSKFNITFRNCEELDGWHAVFGKTVYGFDVLKAISEVRAPPGAGARNESCWGWLCSSLAVLHAHPARACVSSHLSPLRRRATIMGSRSCRWCSSQAAPCPRGRTRASSSRRSSGPRMMATTGARR